MEKQLIPQLRFPEFEETFKAAIFDDILSVTRLAGYEYSKYWQEDDNKEIIALRGYNIGNGKLVLRDLSYISNKLSLQLKRSRLYKGDIIYPCVGSIGNAVVIEEDDKYHIQQNIAKITCNKKTNPFFVSQFLMSHLGIKEVLKFNATSSQPNVLVGSLRQFKINLPSFPEQQKIASFLTDVDDKITKLTKKKELLEQYKKGVMQKIFNQELIFKDDEDNAFPKWVNRKLGQLSVCMDNKRIPLNGFERNTRQGSIPYWGANGIVDYIDEYIFDETIVLLAEDGGYFNDFQTRPIANISYGKSWVNNHAHVIKAKDGLTTNEFLYYSLVHKNIMGYVNGGTRAKLNKSDMLQIKMILPSSIKEQTKIANFLSEIDVKIEALNTKIENSKAFKKGLLQKMFV